MFSSVVDRTLNKIADTVEFFTASVVAILGSVIPYFDDLVY